MANQTKYPTLHGAWRLALPLGTIVQALLVAGGTIARAAQAAYLHRNSLAYRLERIRQISGLDPNDPADRFTLKLALLLAPLGDQ